MSRSNIPGKKWFALLVAAIIVGASTSATAFQVTAEGVRNRISQRIRSKYEAQNLQIKVVPFESDYWTQRGRFKSIVISADKLTRKHISIRNTYTKVFDVTLDIGKLYEEGAIRTTSRKNTVLTARIYKDDLNKLLAKKKSAIQNLQVAFENNQLVVMGKYRFGAKVRLVGVLKVEKHRYVNFVPTAASVNRIPLPAGPLRQVLSKINPLIDFQSLPLSPEVDKLEVHTNYILVKG